MTNQEEDNSNDVPKVLMEDGGYEPLIMQRVEMPNGVITYIPLGVHYDEDINDWVVNSKENPMPTRDEFLAAKIDELKTVLNEFDIPASDYTSITDLINVLNESIKSNKVKTELEEIKATQKEILTKLNSEVVSYKGNSTDDKSVIAPDAKRGDEFIELDTKEIYFYTTEWAVF